MAVQETSKETYKDLNTEGKLSSGQFEVWKAIKYLESATDMEIAKYCGYTVETPSGPVTDGNRVRPRRFELMEMGEVHEDGERPCGVTGRKAKTWRGTRPEDFQKDKEAVSCASDKEMNKVHDILRKCNKFQLETVKTQCQNLLNHPELIGKPKVEVF